MLLWQIHRELMNDVPSITTKCSEQSAVAVHDNEAEPR